MLPDGSWIAVVTGPRQLVVAGWPGPLADATAALERAGLTCRPAPATRAVHGPIAAPAVPAFELAMRGLALAAPEIELYSANTGRLTSAAEATDPGFWARQLAEPVRFADAVDALTAGPGRLLLIEVGPGQMLTSALRRHPTVISGRHRLLPTLEHRPVEPQAQIRSALTALGTVWAEGHSVDWAEVGDLVEVGRTSVPGYPFERTRLAAAAPVQPVEPLLEPVLFAEPALPIEPVLFAEPMLPVEPVAEFVPPVVEFVPPVVEFVPPEPVPEPVIDSRPVAAAAPVAVTVAPVVATPAPVAATPSPTARSVRSPGTATRLRQIWLGVLGEHEIGPDTDFFDLGGNSLTAVELMAEVRAEFGVELRIHRAVRPSDPGRAGRPDRPAGGLMSEDPNAGSNGSSLKPHLVRLDDGWASWRDDRGARRGLSGRERAGADRPGAGRGRRRRAVRRGSKATITAEYQAAERPAVGGDPEVRRRPPVPRGGHLAEPEADQALPGQGWRPASRATSGAGSTSRRSPTTCSATALKNDTIGFVGPVGWGRWTDDGAAAGDATRRAAAGPPDGLLRDAGRSTRWPGRCRPIRSCGPGWCRGCSPRTGWPAAPCTARSEPLALTGWERELLSPGGRRAQRAGDRRDDGWLGVHRVHR